MDTDQLAEAVNEASRKMWHAQMIVDGTAKPAPKVIATLDKRIAEYRAANAAWAASYFRSAA